MTELRPLKEIAAELDQACASALTALNKKTLLAFCFNVVWHGFLFAKIKNLINEVRLHVVNTGSTRNLNYTHGISHEVVYLSWLANKIQDPAGTANIARYRDLHAYWENMRKIENAACKSPLEIGRITFAGIRAFYNLDTEMQRLEQELDSAKAEKNIEPS